MVYPAKRKEGGDWYTCAKFEPIHEAHFDALIARLPGRAASRLPTVAHSFNDPQRLADVQAFFAEQASRLLGGPRILHQTLKQIRLNSALKQAQLPSLEAFLLSRAEAPSAGARTPRRGERKVARGKRSAAPGHAPTLPPRPGGALESACLGTAPTAPPGREE